ncbi:hypothetical protein [Azospirillum sp.]|uniref:hypothetical protein n=1 Tax=Azospirillum sp. TaxID=34012 RepID=UPI002D344F2F|nr:hypothetical protein [Azospirillum sp.]HYD67899.1 hypothetical protein [Azospirillum sp.]
MGGDRWRIGETVAVAASVLVAALLSGTTLAAPEGPRRWSADLKAARVVLAVERQGKGEALVLTVTPLAGARIEPQAVRIDAPTLVSRRLKGRFPTTVRSEGKPGGAIRAALPLDAPGAVRLGDADSNDGALRVEYRACAAGPKSCTVERADIPLRVAP